MKIYKDNQGDYWYITPTLFLISCWEDGKWHSVGGRTAEQIVRQNSAYDLKLQGWSIFYASI